MAWEYRLIKAETEELYERALNAAVRKDEKGVEQLFGRRVEESLTRPWHAAVDSDRRLAMVGADEAGGRRLKRPGDRASRSPPLRKIPPRRPDSAAAAPAGYANLLGLPTD